MRIIGRECDHGPRVLVLGTFDGVHLGHRELIETGRRYARERGVQLRVCTFDRHPLEVVAPQRAPGILTTIPEKAALMARIGVDEMQLLPFRREMADMEPEAFLAMLRAATDLRAVAAGWNYTFGRGGRGNAELLQEDGKKHGYDVLILPPVRMHDGTVLSSSAIRERLEKGAMEEAEQMLGHPYGICARSAGGTEDGWMALRVKRGKMLPPPGAYDCLWSTGNLSGRSTLRIGPGSGGIGAELRLKAERIREKDLPIRLTLPAHGVNGQKSVIPLPCHTP